MGSDHRIRYLRKQSWSTKGNTYRKVKTPGTYSLTLSFVILRFDALLQAEESQFNTQQRKLRDLKIRVAVDAQAPSQVFLTSAHLHSADSLTDREL